MKQVLRFRSNIPITLVISVVLALVGLQLGDIGGELCGFKEYQAGFMGLFRMTALWCCGYFGLGLVPGTFWLLDVRKRLVFISLFLLVSCLILGGMVLYAAIAPYVLRAIS